MIKPSLHNEYEESVVINKANSPNTFVEADEGYNPSEDAQLQVQHDHLHQIVIENNKVAIPEEAQVPAEEMNTDILIQMLGDYEVLYNI